MKTIFIFPILFLVFGVSEHHTAAVEDCDEDDFTSSPQTKSAKHQVHHTQRKHDIISSRQPQQYKYKETIHQLQRPQQPDVQHKKQIIQTVRKSFKVNNAAPPLQLQTQRRRPPPQKRTFNRRQQKPMGWPPKPKPMNLVIKPIVQTKSLDSAAKRKLTDFFPAYPYKKQKRIKIVPAYEEYETYPETEYVHEIVYPPEPRAYDYVEVDNAPSYGVPCDHNDSDYKEHSSEIANNNRFNAREMDRSSTEFHEKDEEITSTEKSSESEIRTEKEIEVTTPITPVQEATSAIETRNGDIPISSSPEALTNVMEMLMRGLLALVSCMKSKTPVLDDIISNVLNTAINTCNALSS